MIPHLTASVFTALSTTLASSLKIDLVYYPPPPPPSRPLPFCYRPLLKRHASILQAKLKHANRHKAYDGSRQANFIAQGKKKPQNSPNWEETRVQ